MATTFWSALSAAAASSANVMAAPLNADEYTRSTVAPCERSMECARAEAFGSSSRKRTMYLLAIGSVPLLRLTTGTSGLADDADGAVATSEHAARASSATTGVTYRFISQASSERAANSRYQ